MAMDFPSSPVSGATYQGYTFDGTAWNYTAKPGMIICSDTPPANPPVGQQWFRTTNGQLYVYVDDGTSKQWVQCAGSAGSPGIWEPVPGGDRGEFTLAAVSQFDVKDLGVYKKLKMHGAIALSVQGGLALRTSSDNGASFYAGASDYSFQYALFNATTLVANSGAASLYYLSTTVTDAGATVFFNTLIENFNVAGGDKGGNTECKIRSSGSVSKMTWGNAINLSAAMNAIRFAPSVAATLTGKVTIEGMRG